MSTPLLEIHDLAVAYGPAQVLYGVDLTIDRGEVVALMGRNGMGKTTTVRAITSILKPLSGSIRFDGHDTVQLPVHRTARLGIGLVPEGRRCFGPLSVEENLVSGARPGYWTLERVHDLFPRLGERRSQLARTLSGGEQQMLAIGRALMTNPRLMILDEATEGLAPVVRQEIWRALHRLKAEGLAILIIDKSLGELRSIAGRCVILDRGRSVWTGSPAAIGPDIAARHLGV